MKGKIQGFLSDDQFGFRRRVGTREAILSLRQIVDKRIRKDKTTFLGFVDMEKAFDNVNGKTLFINLRQAGIDYRHRRLIYNHDKHETGLFLIASKKEEACIEKDVRQGCSLSPYLFNISTGLMIKLEEKCRWG